MEAFEVFEHAGFRVELHYDEDGGEYANPREGDQLGTMVCWHPDYVLGDEQIVGDADRGNRGAFRRDKHGAAVTVFQSEGGRDDFSSMELVERYLRVARRAIVTLPLYLYDHSGITMTAGSNLVGRGETPSGGRDSWGNARGWDTTMCGFIYTNAERCAELCGTGEDGGLYAPDDWAGTPLEWVASQLDVEVRLYAAYLEGQVYGYTVEDDRGDEVGSCWGFLPDVTERDELAYIRAEARAEAESARDYRAKRAVEVVRGWSLAHGLAVMPV